MISNLKKAVQLLQSKQTKSGIRGIVDAISIREKFFIFPFIPHSGIVDLTTAGYTAIGSKPQNFPSFIQLISGTEAFTLEWEGSTKRYFPDDVKTDDLTCPKMNCDYKIGKYWKGDVVIDDSGIAVKNETISGGDFVGEMIVRTLTVRITEEWTEEDKLRIFLIPSFLPETPDPIEGRPRGMRVVKCSQWLIVEDYQNHYSADNEQFVYCEVRFRSLNDLFSGSGQTLWQLAQMNGGIGGGFAFPLVIQKKDTNGNQQRDYEVQLDENCLSPVGVKYIQVECQGIAPTSTFYAMGRPCEAPKKNKDGTYSTFIYAPRHLLPSEMEAPLQDPLSTFSIPQTTYVLYQGAYPTISNFIDWKNLVQGFWDLTVRKTNQGFIFGDDYTTIIQPTNPTTSADGNNDDANYVYWDPDWKFNKGGKSILNQAKYRLANGYSQYPLPKNVSVNGIIGNTFFDISKLTNQTMANILSANAIIFNSYQTLPMITQQFTKVKINLPTGLLNYIPIIGGWLNEFFNGVSTGFNVIKKSSEWPSYTGINFFISREYLDFQVNGIFATANHTTQLNDINTGGMSKEALANIKGLKTIATSMSPLIIDAFHYNNNETGSIGMISGASMTETAFMAKISDKISLIPYNFNTQTNDYSKQSTSYVMSTALLGQYIGDWKEDPNFGRVQDIGEVCLFDQEFEVLDSEQEITYNKITNLYPNDNSQQLNYAIDAFMYQGIYDGPMIITAFYDNPAILGREQSMIYQVYIKSQAQYHNGNLRDWFTRYKTSYIDCDNGQLPISTFPKSIPQPVPFDVSFYEKKNIQLWNIEKSYNGTITDFDYSGGYAQQVMNNWYWNDLSINKDVGTTDNYIHCIVYYSTSIHTEHGVSGTGMDDYGVGLSLMLDNISTMYFQRIEIPFTDINKNMDSFQKLELAYGTISLDAQIQQALNLTCDGQYYEVINWSGKSNITYSFDIKQLTKTSQQLTKADNYNNDINMPISVNGFYTDTSIVITFAGIKDKNNFQADRKKNTSSLYYKNNLVLNSLKILPRTQS